MWKVFNKGCGIFLFWLDYFNCNIRSWGKRRPKSRVLDAPLTSLTPKTGGRKAFPGDCGWDRAERGCGARSLVSGAAPAGRLCGPRKGMDGWVSVQALSLPVSLCAPWARHNLSVSSFHPSTARPVNPIEPCFTPALV